MNGRLLALLTALAVLTFVVVGHVEAQSFFE